jgi:tetratricopeptide (TPR) repeat protein
MLLGFLHPEMDFVEDLPTTETSHEIALAQMLASQLGGLPLAINQIANYVLDAECELEDFVEIFSDFHNRNSLLEQDPGNLHMGYPHSLSTVWDISMSRIERSNKNSGHLLQLLSLFDPDGVPEILLDGSDRQRDGSDFLHLQYLQNKLQYLNAIKPLLQQSMVMKNKVQHTVSMHRLVGAITLSRIAKEDRQARFDEALELLYRVYPQITREKASLNEQWPRCRLYVPQVVALEKYYRESDSPLVPQAKFATVLANASWFLFEQGLPGQAMQLLPTARAVGEATINGNELAVATIYRTLGGIYLDINKPQASLDNFSRQMKVMECSGSSNDLAVAHGLSNCALAELSVGNYEASRRDLEKAQEIRLKYPGQAESYRALTLDILGILDGMQGNYSSAVQHLEEAIKLYDEELGVGNYLTAL